MLNPVAVAIHGARAGWRGVDLTVATAVALAESGGNEAKPGGLWNLPGVAGGDPAANAVAAYARWRAGGWGQWASHRNKAYMLLMPIAQAAVLSGDVAAIVNDPGTALGGAAGALAGGVKAAAAAGVPGGTILESANSALGLAYKAGAWMSDPNNWQRVAQVVLGAGMVIGGLVMLARGAATNAVGAVAGGLVKKVIK
jgi:hypothetical protein